MAPFPEPAAVYTRRSAGFAAEEKRLARVSLHFSVVRGVLFLGFVVSLGVLLVRAGAVLGVGWWAFAAAWLVAFLGVLPAHDRILASQRRAGDLRTMNEEGLLRLERAWDRLPVPSVTLADTDCPLARDLDLFGPASLFQLLATAHSPAAKTMLAGWLLAPAPPEEIVRRQEAVAELAPEVDDRQRIEVVTRALDEKPFDTRRFQEWAEGRPWLLARPVLIALSRLLPLPTVVLLAGAIWGPLPFGPAGLCLTLNLLLTYAHRERLEETLSQVEAREGEMRIYAQAMEAAAGRGASAQALRSIEGVLTSGVPAHRWMERLQRRVELAAARHSSLLHFLLQILLLWDFHIVWTLERWQRAAGPQVRGWLAALAEAEALGALAALRFDNPEWSFPHVDVDADRIAARGLGHPLIAPDRRVDNDVEIGPGGTFLLVTGSNMSGKSTLLRAAGLNAVLAQAGGPVCAAALRMPPVEIATSILIEDSLAAGVSFFMAEVLRVKSVVEAADRCADRGGRLLYLLDEVLRGTNSGERQIAVRQVLHHLLRRGAIGAVSTHDLHLAEIDDLRAVCVPVHFRETLHPGGDGPAMTFDYVMRPGVATTVNALKLMELVGLEAE
jgi:MutS domain V